jgi:hypothetical protein
VWICPECNQQFKNSNQNHSCNDRTVADFLQGKSAQTIALFQYFLEQYKTIGDFVLHPAKSRIALARNTRFCSINQLGKDFVHIVFQFDKPYYDNLCFLKIGQLPNSSRYNHHCRLYHPDDINEEVRKFMKLAYEQDSLKA